MHAFSGHTLRVWRSCMARPLSDAPASDELLHGRRHADRSRGKSRKVSAEGRRRPMTPEPTSVAAQERHPRLQDRPGRGVAPEIAWGRVSTGVSRLHAGRVPACHCIVHAPDETNDPLHAQLSVRLLGYPNSSSHLAKALADTDRMIADQSPFSK